MKPENRKFLDENRHYYDTLVRAYFLPGLTAMAREEMLRIMREEFQPKYIGDLWCPNCVADLVKNLYRHYDQWLATNPDPDAIIVGEDKGVKKVKAKFPSNKNNRRK